MNYKQQQHSIIMARITVQIDWRSAVQCRGTAILIERMRFLHSNSSNCQCSILLSFAVNFFTFISSTRPSRSSRSSRSHFLCPLAWCICPNAFHALRLPVKYNFRYIYFMFIAQVTVSFPCFAFILSASFFQHHPNMLKMITRSNITLCTWMWCIE